MIDTISTVFGFLDGTSSIDEENYNIDILFNGTSIKGELQDAFLEYVEDIESQE